MFRGHVRRSGSLRSVWHRRERKRRPVELPLATGTGAEPRPATRTRPAPAECEWLCGDPYTMIRCVVRLATDRGIVFHLSPRAVERRLRLFFCACCRLHWDVLPVPCRDVVRVVERHAEGLADARAVRAARRTARDAEQAARPVPAFGGHSPAAWAATHAAGLAVAATESHARPDSCVVHGGSLVAAPDQADLLRDIFGNPFRPVAIEAAWFTRTVVALAGVIRAGRVFELMPVLGDALQDAGCDRAELLDHCRDPGPHAAGCWLLDGLLRTG